jgi:hypothetical protein
MDSSSESFRYDGGDDAPSNFWKKLLAAFVIGMAVMAVFLVLLFMYSPGTAVLGMPDSNLWWILRNYEVNYDAGKYTRTVKTPEVPIPSATENLSVVWKDNMLSSGSDSAWGKSMYRQEGMCGQC